MGSYADKHGGNSFMGDWFTAVTHPFNAQDALVEKYTTQVNFQNTQANTNLALQQQESARKEAEKNATETVAAQTNADTQQIIKYIAIVVLLLIIAFAIWYYLKHRG